MLKALTISLLLGCLLSSGCASTKQSPFEKLASHEVTNGGDWATSLSSYRTLFGDEVERLGNATYTYLPAFLGANVTRHYWCSSFVEDTEDLEGDADRQRYAFSLLILEQGLVLLKEEGSPDEILDIKASKVSMSYRAAILAERLGFNSLAVQHKNSVQSLLAKDRILRGALPVCSAEDKALYESIK